MGKYLEWENLIVTDVQSENVTACWSSVRVCSSRDSCCLVSMLADHTSAPKQSPAGLYSFSLSVRPSRCLSLKSLWDRVSYMSKHAHFHAFISSPCIQIFFHTGHLNARFQSHKLKPSPLFYTLRSFLCQPCSTYHSKLNISQNDHWTISYSSLHNPIWFDPSSCRQSHSGLRVVERPSTFCQVTKIIGDIQSLSLKHLENPDQTLRDISSFVWECWSQLVCSRGITRIC